MPTQLLISGADWVVHHGPQHAFFDHLGTRAQGAARAARLLPRHARRAGPRAGARARCARFLLERLRRAAGARRSLLDADRSGSTRDEADALAAPLPALSPRGLYWAATRASLRFGGLLSDGIALGHETGFDSGSTLDYVYRNAGRGRHARSAG